MTASISKEFIPDCFMASSEAFIAISARIETSELDLSFNLGLILVISSIPSLS